MRTIPNVSRRYVALAFTAALVGAAMGSPAPAAARTQPQNEELTCNPTFELCNIQYMYFDSPSFSHQVGFADENCGNAYTLHWGVATSHVQRYYGVCPI